jgi:hypothetical protein
MYIYDVTDEKNSNPVSMSLHSFRKKFSLMRAFVDDNGNVKPCVICGNMATQEAVFTVDGATIIEKYCDSCSKKNFPQ